jgi:hypothetical protein
MLRRLIYLMNNGAVNSKYMVHHLALPFNYLLFSFSCYSINSNSVETVSFEACISAVTSNLDLLKLPQAALRSLTCLIVRHFVSAPSRLNTHPNSAGSLVITNKDVITCEYL